MAQGYWGGCGVGYISKFSAWKNDRAFQRWLHDWNIEMYGLCLFQCFVIRLTYFMFTKEKARVAYFWFIMNDYGSNYPVHKSVLVAALEVENTDKFTVLGFAVVSSLLLTLIAGFISRILFSFGDDDKS